MKPYDPREYWETRLSETALSVGSVGHKGQGVIYNSWLYRRRFDALKNALRKGRLSLKGRSLLEVGVGSGAYIPFWQEQQMGPYLGLDITQTSVAAMQQRFPELDFLQQDITHPPTEHLRSQTFDVVTALDVLFHIVNDADFSNALQIISGLTRPGGWLILSDGFCANAWGPAYHEFHRTKEHYQRELANAGFEIRHLEPIFFSMTTPLCTDKTALSHFYTRLIGLEARGIKVLNQYPATAWLNHLVGGSLYLLDSAAGYFSHTGPSLKFLLAQKKA